jgi:hypothetical protein
MPRRKITEQERQERISKDSRRNLSRDRALERRKLRRNANEVVRVPQKLDPQENDGPLLNAGERLTNWRRYGDASRLDQHVKFTHSRRIWRTAWNCFKHPYSPKGREKFKRVLISVMQGQTEKSAAIARLFHETIYGEHSRYDLVLTQSVVDRQAWILRFLKDEPSVGGELKKWMRRMRERYPEA